MNIKKRVLSALAALTAFAALSTATVGATNLGYSDGDVVESKSVEIKLDSTQPTDATLDVSGVTVDVSIPAGTFDTDSVEFVADVIESADVTAAFEKLPAEVKDTKVLSLYFKDAEGNPIDVTGKNVEISLSDGSYNTLYYFNPETGELEKVDATVEDGKMTFVAADFPAVYALANVVEETSTPSTDEPSTVTPSTPGTSNGDGKPVTTGDSSSVIFIIGAVAAVALVTAVVATKSKKSSR